MTDANRAVVAALTSVGIPAEAIAKHLGMHRTTLDKHYKVEREQGKDIAHAAVAANLYRMATGTGREALTAAIFWAKAQMRWREVREVELSGKDGGAIKTEDTTPADRLKPYLVIIRQAVDAVDDPPDDGAEAGGEPST